MDTERIATLRRLCASRGAPVDEVKQQMDAINSLRGEIEQLLDAHDRGTLVAEGAFAKDRQPRPAKHLGDTNPVYY